MKVLRIKKDIDLDILLEKFYFTYFKNEEIYQRGMYVYKSQAVFSQDAYICISADNRVIYSDVDQIGYWSFDELHGFDDGYCKYIQDLIDADLVEEIEEDGVYDD